MTTLARLVHPQKALSPIVVTESGMITARSLLHPSNACFIVVNDSGMVNLEQIVVTESGMLTYVSLVHRRKASVPIVVTESGMVTSERLVHSLNAPQRGWCTLEMHGDRSSSQSPG